MNDYVINVDVVWWWPVLVQKDERDGKQHQQDNHWVTLAKSSSANRGIGMAQMVCPWDVQNLLTSQGFLGVAEEHQLQLVWTGSWISKYCVRDLWLRKTGDILENWHSFMAHVERISLSIQKIAFQTNKKGLITMDKEETSFRPNPISWCKIKGRMKSGLCIRFRPFIFIWDLRLSTCLLEQRVRLSGDDRERGDAPQVLHLLIGDENQISSFKLSGWAYERSIRFTFWMEMPKYHQG